MPFRRQGISGAVRPAKKAPSITPSNFEIAALIGRFERQYDKAFELTRSEDIGIIFGERVAAYFGQDAAEGHFKNARGGSLWIKSHVGNTGTAIDAVIAFLTKNDAGAQPAIKFSAGYKETKQYGTSGNRIGTYLTNGTRYATTAAAVALFSATSMVVDAIGDVKIGDIVRFTLTNGGTATVYKKITAKSETAGTISWSGPLHGSVGAAIGDAVEVLGLRIQTFQQSQTGVVEERERDLGEVFCSMEPEVVDYYYQNVHKNNRYLVLEDQNSSSTLENRFPANSSAVEYLATGADGTAPTTSAHWSYNHAALGTVPFRIICNPETTLEAYFNALDTYLQARDRTDFPIALITIPANLDFEDLRTTGRRYQRSTLRSLIPLGTWWEVEDPFSSSPIAPARQIPPVGQMMGRWIRTTRDRGIHTIPATAEDIVDGVIGVVAPKEFSATERTQLLDAGMNIAQDVPGQGIRYRNWITSSTARENLYGHTLLQSNFYRESVKDSIGSVENEPNVERRIAAGRAAIYTFMLFQWRAGSNGQVPEGETFGQYRGDDGELLGFDDLVEVIGDVRNNPKSQLLAGNRDYDIFHGSPTPTGSIIVGVGIKL